MELVLADLVLDIVVNLLGYMDAQVVVVAVVLEDVEALEEMMVEVLEIV